MDITNINLRTIRERSKHLSKLVRHTPSTILSSKLISKHLDNSEIFLKLECMQFTGTFKARGALSVALEINKDKKKFGITAASAGNHAIAAAWAAQQLGLSAKVVMQSNANPFRIRAAKAEGAEIILKEPGAPTFKEAERLVTDEQRTFIHPFEGIYTSLGASGVGLELMDDIPDLDAVVVSVGGGGLISGIAAAVKEVNKNCKVYGVEPEGAISMSQSLLKGQPVTLEKVDTVADSLSPPMSLPMGLAICQKYVDEIVTVSDDMICAVMTLFQEEAKLAVEPAAGAALAGMMLPLKPKLRNKRIGLIVCGANIDTNTYISLITRGREKSHKLLQENK